jgi:hypothetical protein
MQILRERAVTSQQILAWARLELEKSGSVGSCAQAGGPHGSSETKLSPSPHCFLAAPEFLTFGQQSHNNVEHRVASNA